MTGIRIVVYGMGRVGSRITRHAIEKKAEVVAGYVRSVESQERLTQEFPGLEICLPDRPLRDHRADVLLIAHSGQYSEIYEVARRGAEAGMDVITLSSDRGVMLGESIFRTQQECFLREGGQVFMACFASFIALFCAAFLTLR